MRVAGQAVSPANRRLQAGILFAAMLHCVSSAWSASVPHPHPGFGGQRHVTAGFDGSRIPVCPELADGDGYSTISCTP